MSRARGAVDTAEVRQAEEALPRIVLRLYVAGGAPRSAEAIRNVRRLCAEQLRGRVDLAVVDIYQEPWRAREANLVAAPTLIVEQPLPRRCFIGSMTDLARLLMALDVREEGET